MPALYTLESKGYQSDTVSVPNKPKISEAEYWDKYYHYPEIVYEWNNGYLEEKPVSDHATYLSHNWFSHLLNHYLETKPVAELTGLEIGFRLSLPQTVEIRRPDLGVVLNSNPVKLLPNDKSYKGTFDLCIEAISDSNPTDIKRDTIDKKAAYAKVGVTEYYILDGHDRYNEFYRLGKGGIYVPIKPVNGEIIQSTVLPGFQFRIADLFSKPSAKNMIDDLVYQSFVLPDYSKAKHHAQQAEQHAQQEKQARQQAEQQAQQEKWARQQAEQQAQQEKQARQRLADKLRSLGIDPDNI